MANMLANQFFSKMLGRSTLNPVAEGEEEDQSGAPLDIMNSVVYVLLLCGVCGLVIVRASLAYLPFRNGNLRQYFSA